MSKKNNRRGHDGGHSGAGSNRGWGHFDNSGDDTLIATGGNAKLDGGNGNDVLIGAGGNDRLYGGRGDDSISGGDGRNQVDAGDGNDTVSTGQHDDRIDAGRGDDVVASGDGRDRVDGGRGNDTIDAGGDRDTVDGGSGDDSIFGGEGDDCLSGGSGDDTINGGEGHDRIDGGDGNDLIDGGNGQDRAYGGDGDDTLNGGAGDDTLSGGRGDDLIDGGDGDDRLYADRGDDTLIGGAGNDLIHGDRDDDVIRGDGDGFEHVPGPTQLQQGANGTYDIQGLDSVVLSVDFLGGSAGFDNSFGYYLADTNGNPIDGEIIFRNVKCSDDDAGDDVRTISLTADDLGGAASLGFFLLPDGGDRNWRLRDGDDVSFRQDSQGDWQAVSNGRVLYSAYGRDTVFFSNADLNKDGLDHEVDNSLSGNSAWEDLLGGGDNDFNDATFQITVLDGPQPASNDRIYADRGDDLVNGDRGDDFIDGGRGDDTLQGGTGDDTIDADRDDDLVIHNVADNQGFHDTYDGGKGQDTLELEVTEAELAVLADDIAAFQDVLADDGPSHGHWYYNWHHHGNDDRAFDFEAIGLSVRNFEALNLTIVNFNPDAADDAVVTDEDTALLIDVLANDSDADGDTLTITAVTQPANGTVEIVGNRILFTPNDNYNGPDSFTYTVFDGVDGFDTATVSLTIDPVNDAPVAVDDTITVVEDTTTTIDVLANDIDIDGDTLTIVTASALNGTVTINADSTLSYTPNGNYYGTDTISYTISDGALTSSATVSVTVTNDGTDALFTDGNDTVDFNTVTPFDYDDGNTSDALGGDDLIILPVDQAAADAAGFDTGAPFNAGSGNDTVVGGDLGDTINAGDGADSVNGGTGDDLILGAGGNDTLTGDAGDDTLDGGAGDDELSGGAGADSIAAGGGDDSIDAGDDNDFVDAGDGNDEIIAGAGDDTVVAGLGDDSVAGGDGDDLVDGGEGNDQLSGDLGDDTLFGAAGDDALDGGEGNDLLDAGTGNDVVDAGAGDDSVSAGDGNDAVLGGDGNDTIAAGAGDDAADGGTGDDLISGDAGNDTLSGGDGDDTLDGGADNDQLSGGAGADSISAGSGDDSIDAGDDNDFVDAGDGNDEIIAGAGDDTVVAGLGDDSVAGGDGDDLIDGGEGNDQLSGDLGDDTLFGAAGDDVIDGGDGNDVVDGGVGDDSVSAGAGDDAVLGGEGNDTLFGDDGDDTLLGGAGDDEFFGGTGDDSISGGAGSDNVTFTGDADEYDVTFNDDGTVTIVDTVPGRDGTTTLEDVETATFADDIFFTDGTNNAPEAFDETATTDEDTAVSIDILSNDTDFDSDLLTVASANAANGSVTIETDGSLTYTGNADFNGSDTITYTIDDGRGGTDVGEVSVTVNAVNDAPVITVPTGGALRFDGNAANHVQVAHDADLSGSSWTVEAWVTTTDADSQFNRVVTKPVGGGQTYSLVVRNGEAHIRFDDASIGQQFVQAGFVADGQPHHIAGVFDDAGNTLSLYVDGQLTGSIATSATPRQGTEELNIGRFNDGFGQGFRGDVSEVRVWSAPRSATEIANSFDQVLDSANEPDLALYMTFDPTFAEPGKVQDLSGHGFDGTIVGSLQTVPGGAPVDQAIQTETGQEVRFFGCAVADVDAADGTNQIQVTVESVNGTVDVSSGTGASITGDQSKSITITGTPAQVSASLSNMTFTPDAGFVGTETVTLTADDLGNSGSGGALTDVQTFTILVVEPNVAPEAADDAATVDEDGTILIDALANDTDDNGDALTITAITVPDNGTAVIEGNQIRYTPDADFNGTDTISYTVTDGKGEFDTAQVAVTVNAVNDAPVAADDTATTDEDVAVTVNVLGNDSDIDGDALTVTTASAANGSVVIESDGSLTYTPDTDFNGSDTISYTVSDGDLTDTAEVAVTVSAVNDAPVATNDSATTDEDTAVTIDVLDNDADVDGDALTVTAANAANGSVVIESDGSLTYTPDADFNGTDTISYTLNDGDLTDTAEVAVTVNAVNDAPEIDAGGSDLASDLTVGFARAQALDANDLLANFVHQVRSATVVDEGALDVLHIGSGGISRTPMIEIPLFSAGEVRADDRVSVLIDGVIQRNGSDQDLFFGVRDSDQHMSLFSVDGVIGGLFADAVLPNGSLGVAFPENPPANDRTTLGFGSSIENFSIRIDLDGDADQITLLTGDGTVLNFSGDAGAYLDADDAVQILLGSDGSPEVYEVVSVAYSAEVDGLVDSGTVLFTDVDAADTHSATVTNVATNGDTNGIATATLAGFLTLGAVTASSAGSTGAVDWSFEADDDLFAYLGAGESLELAYTVTVDDNAGGTDAETVTVTINGRNDGPVAADDVATTDEDTATGIAVLTNDSDVDGDTLTVTSAIATNGQVVIETDGSLTYTPDADFNGTDTISYVVSDGELTDTAQVAVTVNAVNDAPVAADDTATTDEDVAVTVNVLGNDSDIDGDDLTVTTASAANGTVVIESDGSLTYTPDADFNGSDTISYTVSDGDLTDTATAEVAVTVSAVNDAPEIDAGGSDLSSDLTVGFTRAQTLDANDLLANYVNPFRSAVVIDEGALDVLHVSARPGSGFDRTVLVEIPLFSVGELDADTRVTINIDGLIQRVGSDQDILFGVRDTDQHLSFFSSDGGTGLLLADALTGNGPFGIASPDNPPLTDRTIPTGSQVEDFTLRIDLDGDTDRITLVEGNGAAFNASGDPGQYIDPQDAVSIIIGSDQFHEVYEIVSLGFSAEVDGLVDSGSITFTDVDLGDTHSAAVTGVAATGDTNGIATATLAGFLTLGAVTASSAGSIGSVGWSFAADDDLFAYLGSGESLELAYTVTVDDNAGGTDAETVTVTINGRNDGPVAADDAATVDEDTFVNIDVLGNDSDIDGDDLTVISATASNGQVVIESDGSLTYTPDPDFFGSDTISYVVSDGELTDTAQVTLTVNDTPDGPVITNDLGFTGTENVPVLLDVLANDSGDGLRIVSTQASSGAAVSFSGAVGDGITLDPSGGNVAGINFGRTLSYDSLAPGDTIADIITFVVEDANGDQAGDAVVTRKTLDLTTVGTTTTASLDLDGVTVTGSASVQSLNFNGLGISGGPFTARLDAGETMRLDFDHLAANVIFQIGTLNNTTGVDGGQVLVEGFDADGASLGTQVLPINFDALDGNISGAFGNVPLSRVDITGQGDAFVMRTLNFDEIQGNGFAIVEIGGVNDAPVIVDQTFAVNEDSFGLFETLDVSDPDRNDSDFDLTLDLVSTPSEGSVSLNFGELDFRLNGGFQDVSQGEVRDVEIVYTATDPSGAVSDPGTITIQITGNNDPVTGNDDTATVDEDSSVLIDVLANDSDIDALDVPSILSVGTAANGTVAIEGGQIRYTPDADFFGSDSFTYTVTDGNGSTDTAQVAVTVNAVNDAPVAADDTATTDEDVAVTVNVLGNDSDIDGDDLTVTTASAANGSVVIESDGSLTYTPDADFNGSDTISYTVSDGDLTDTAEVAVTVNAVNDAPEIALPTADSQITLDFSQASGLGATNNNLLRNDVSIAALPGGGFAAIDQNATGSGTRISLYDANGALTGSFLASETADSAEDPTQDLVALGNGTIAAMWVEGRNDVLVRIFEADGTPVTGELEVKPGGANSTDGNAAIAATPDGGFVVAYRDGLDLMTNRFDADGNQILGPVRVGPSSNVPGTLDVTATASGGYAVTYIAFPGDGTGTNVRLSIVDAAGTPVAEDVIGDRNSDGNSLLSFTAGIAELSNGNLVVVWEENNLPNRENFFRIFDASGNPVTDDELIVNWSNGQVDTEVMALPDGGFVVSFTNEGAATDLDSGATFSRGSFVQRFDASGARVGEPVFVADSQAPDMELTGDGDIAVVSRSVPGGELVVSELSVPKDPFATDEDTPIVLTGFSISDVDAGEGTGAVAAVLSVTNGTIDVTDTGATITGDGSGSVTVTGALADVNAAIGSINYSPDAGFNGTDSLQIDVSDLGNTGAGGVLTGSVSVTLTVNAVNDAPVAVDDAAITNEDSLVNIDVLVNDSDADGDSLTVDSASAANGSVVIEADGSLTYTPDADFNGSDTISYTISDGQGATDTAEVAITVNPVADRQTVSGPVDAGSVDDADAPVTIDLLANAFDADGDDLDVQGVTVTSSNAGRTVVFTVDQETGELVVDPTQFGDLLDGQSETVTIDYAVSDDSADFTDSIGSPNVPNGGVTYVIDFDDNSTATFVRSSGPFLPVAQEPLNGAYLHLNPNNGFGGSVTVRTFLDGVETTRDASEVTFGNYGGTVNGGGFSGAFSNSTIDWTVHDLDTADGERCVSIRLEGISHFTDDGLTVNSANFVVTTDVAAQATLEVTGVTRLVFTNGDDTVDLNTVIAADADDANVSDAGDGRDIVTLADNATEAAEAGFVVGQTFFGGAGEDNITGGGLDDVIDGGDDNDLILSGAGNDTVFSGDGNNFVRGETGDDSIVGGSNRDSFFGDEGNDTISGGAGRDTLRGGDDNDSLSGDTSDDDLFGGNSNDTLFGGDGFDELSGEAGDDLLDGGIGGDTISGDDGDDTLIGGDGDDVFIFNTGDGADVVATFTAGAGTEDVLDFSGDASITSTADLTFGDDGAGNATVGYGAGDLITLIGVVPGTLDSDDFQF